MKSAFKNDKAKHIELSNLLPDIRFKTNETFPDELTGATIIHIGSPKEDSGFEGGGLVIDYKPAFSNTIKRIGLSFTELGMWIEFNIDL